MNEAKNLKLTSDQTRIGPFPGLSSSTLCKTPSSLQHAIDDKYWLTTLFLVFYTESFLFVQVHLGNVNEHFIGIGVDLRSLGLVCCRFFKKPPWNTYDRVEICRVADHTYDSRRYQVATNTSIFANISMLLESPFCHGAMCCRLLILNLESDRRSSLST